MNSLIEPSPARLLDGQARGLVAYAGSAEFAAEMAEAARHGMFVAQLELLAPEFAMLVIGGGAASSRQALKAAVKAGAIKEYRVASGVRYSRAEIETAIKQGKL